MVLPRLLIPAIFLLAACPSVAAESPYATIDAANPGTECDRLAGDRDDPDLLHGRGVPSDEIAVAEAEPACRAAVASFPEERRYRYELGRVLHRKGDGAAGLPFYQAAAASGSAIAAFAIGVIYEDADGVRRNYRKAGENYRQASDAGYRPAMSALADLYDRGELAPGDSGVGEALKLYRRLVDLGDGWALVDLGQLYSAGRGAAMDKAMAEALYRRGMAFDDPDVVSYAQNSLAFMFAMGVRHLDEAKGLIDDAIGALDENDTGAMASYKDTRAWVLHGLGRDADALVDAEEAVRLDPDVAGYHDRLGDIYAALNRKADALVQWKRALALPAPTPYSEPAWNSEAVRKKIAGGKPR